MNIMFAANIIQAKLLLIMLLAISVLSIEASNAQAEDPLEAPLIVSIAPGYPHAEINHNGKMLKISRNQNSDSFLPKNYSRTSRPCPPFCIQPIELSANIPTYGELELLDFLNYEVANGTGLLVDIRMPKYFRDETVPGAINLPFIEVSSNTDSVLTQLNATYREQQWDFTKSKTLLVFGHGPWSDDVFRATSTLIDKGYPEHLLRYYRGGMQMWKLFALTTIGGQTKTEFDPKPALTADTQG